MKDNDPNPHIQSEDYDNFVSYICGAVFWGLYCALFVYTMTKWRVLSHRPELLASTILLFVLCSMYFILFTLIVYYQNIPLNGITHLGYLANNQITLGQIKIVLAGLANFVGNLTLVYRLWVLLANSKYRLLIAIPAGTSAVGLVSVILIYWGGAPTNCSLGGSCELLGPFVRHFLKFSSHVFPLATNVIATSSILFCIWSDTRHVNAGAFTNRKQFRLVVAGLVEVGMLYLSAQLTLTAFIAQLQVGNTVTPAGIHCVTEIATQIYGIAPTLIVTRINVSKLKAGLDDRGSAVTKFIPDGDTHDSLTINIYAPWRVSQERLDSGSSALDEPSRISTATYSTTSSFGNLTFPDKDIDYDKTACIYEKVGVAEF